MKDGIIAQSGNSRYLKSVANFLSLYPNYETFANALIAGTLPIDLNGVNPAGWQQIGTLLSKSNLLSDETEAAIFGNAADRTVNDGFFKVSELYQHWWRAENSVGETAYVHSPDRNTYPDSGTVDGLTYKYLGVPFENAMKGNVETGSYAGTGKYGSSNKNTLTFSFVPKLVIINGGAYGGYWTANSPYLVVNTTSDGVSNSTCTASLSGKTLSWYSGAHSSNQLNNSTTYYYVAIG